MPIWGANCVKHNWERVSEDVRGWVTEECSECGLRKSFLGAPHGDLVDASIYYDYIYDHIDDVRDVLPLLAEGAEQLGGMSVRVAMKKLGWWG